MIKYNVFSDCSGRIYLPNSNKSKNETLSAAMLSNDKNISNQSRVEPDFFYFKDTSLVVSVRQELVSLTVNGEGRSHRMGHADARPARTWGRSD